LNLTFQLPQASEVVPPPSPVIPAPAPQRHPLFPPKVWKSSVKPCLLKETFSKAAQKLQALSSPQSCSSPSQEWIPTLRQAAQASVQRLQADSVLLVKTPSRRERSYSESDSPNAHSPSNFHPLAQRIRSDLQIGEEFPERERLRIQLTSVKSPFPSPTRGFPSPATLAFTPLKIQEKFETPVESVQTQEGVSCLNCDAQMTPDHQCEPVNI